MFTEIKLLQYAIGLNNLMTICLELSYLVIEWKKNSKFRIKFWKFE